MVADLSCKYLTRAMRTYLEKRRPGVGILFCRMEILPNLFGEWSLHQEWGLVGLRCQTRMDWFADKEQAITALVTLEVAKRQRGYWVEPQQLAMFA